MSDGGLIGGGEAGRIRPGDMLVSALFGAQEAGGGDGLSEDEAVLLGYLVAEGSMSARHKIQFTNWDPEVSGDFTRLMENLFAVPVRNYYDKKFGIHNAGFRDHFAHVYALNYAPPAGN